VLAVVTVPVTHVLRCL